MRFPSPPERGDFIGCPRLCMRTHNTQEMMRTRGQRGTMGEWEQETQIGDEYSNNRVESIHQDEDEVSRQREQQNGDEREYRRS